MKWYEKIGNELDGSIPELDVVEFPTAIGKMKFSLPASTTNLLSLSPIAPPC